MLAKRLIIFTYEAEKSQAKSSACGLLGQANRDCQELSAELNLPGQAVLILRCEGEKDEQETVWFNSVGFYGGELWG